MKIPDEVTRGLARQVLRLRKHSPNILFGAGVAGVITSTVLACRATLKVGDQLDNIRGAIDGIKTDSLQPYLSHRQDVESDRRRSMAAVYTRGSIDIAKSYAPAVLIGTASIAALTGSHVILTRRYAALNAAYSALSLAYEEYRERVRKDVGEKRELELYRGVEIVEEKGEKILAIDPAKGSPYMQLFAEHNKHWKKSAELNFNFILTQQTYANHLLHSRGHIFLQEVYDMLGFDHTKEACIVGWVRGNADDYVDFGLFEARNKAFANQIERSIWLDFNVDGPIWDLI